MFGSLYTNVANIQARCVRTQGGVAPQLRYVLGEIQSWNTRPKPRSPESNRGQVTHTHTHTHTLPATDLLWTTCGNSSGAAPVPSPLFNNIKPDFSDLTCPCPKANKATENPRGGKFPPRPQKNPGLRVRAELGPEVCLGPATPLHTEGPRERLSEAAACCSLRGVGQLEHMYQSRRFLL